MIGKDLPSRRSMDGTSRLISPGPIILLSTPKMRLNSVRIRRP